MTRKIEVDDEVYAWLQRHARPFEDSPNSVLRRLAGFDQTHAGPMPEPVSLEERERGLTAQQPMARGEGKVVKGAAKESKRAGKAERQSIIEHYGLRKNEKFSKDENGDLYLIFVGHGYFHGIRVNILPALYNKGRGKLVFGKCIGDYIRLYEGRIADLIPHVERLSLSNKSKYSQRVFHLNERDGHVFIKEAPSVRLQFVGEIGPI